MTLAAPSSFLSDLCDGINDLLAADGPFERVADDAGPSDPSRCPMFTLAMPDVPDTLGSTSPYPLGQDATMADSDVGVQIRVRHADPDPHAVLALEAAAFGILAGRGSLTLSTGIYVVLLDPGASGSLGQDVRQRWGWSLNFTASTYRPTPHRR